MDDFRRPKGDCPPLSMALFWSLLFCSVVLCSALVCCVCWCVRLRENNATLGSMHAWLL